MSEFAHPPKTFLAPLMDANAISAQVSNLMGETPSVLTDHDYLAAYGLNGIPVEVCAQSANIGGTQCGDFVAMKVYSPDKRLANLMVMSRNRDGTFEDVLIPGASLADGYGRLGTPSETILIVETFAAGLALQDATGFGVTVAMYAENIRSVALSIKQTYPEVRIIVCAGMHEALSGRSNMRSVIYAAALVGGLVATPNGASTFDELYRLQGSAAVADQVTNAATPPASDESHSIAFTNEDICAAPMLWPNAVNGPSLISRLIAQLSKHIVMTNEDLIAMALWVFFTHTVDIARVSPILAIRSPIKRCGKTSAMTLLNGLVSKPYPLSNITTAVMYRMVDEIHPTLLLDEADTYLGDSKKDMVGILNSGHTRTNAYVARMEQGKVKRFFTFCPKAIAGIGNMPSTVVDRSIVIRLRRKLPNEPISRYVPTFNDEIVALRAQIARWAQDNRERIAQTEHTPANLNNDRHEDNWEPLFAIASCLGDEWLERAHHAAHALSKTHDEIKCSGEELLRDIKKAFEVEGVSKIATSVLIGRLCADYEGPWATYSANRKSITPREVSNLLADFDIVSKNLRFGGVVVKGYELDQFEDAFSRYLRDHSS